MGLDAIIERTSGGRVIKERIIAAYDQHMLKRSALSIRDGEGVFREIMGSGRYRNVLEIGTYRGVGAAAMSQFCERVMTIDLKFGRMEQLGEKYDRRAFWEKLGIKNIDLFLVKDDAEKAKLVKSLEFDFAFIDGAHDQTVRDDFNLVKRCGTVLFHDYDRRSLKEQNYVCDFVDSLPKSHIKVYDLFALWTA